MKNSFRTHHCAALKASEKGEKVRLSGWVHSIRNHGNLLFFMLRDQYGLVQIVSDSSKNIAIFEEIQKLSIEMVITVDGEVLLRNQENINKKISTGEIEISAKKITILSPAKTPPFPIDQESIVKDEAIRYRYLHLRRQSVAQNIILRSKVTKLVRDFLYGKGFHEIETPILTKATPEGARDFLVPSRVFPGEFYALPQSPQQYKQLLMVGGFDKYFQIARALRDEDSRADRQPEHTQIDMEMSFIERDEIIELLEELFLSVIKKLFPEKKLLKEPFPRLDYYECMNLYGTDKPDLRFDLCFFDVKKVFETTEFKIFQKILTIPDKNGHIKALKIDNVAEKVTRKETDALISLAHGCGLAGIITIVRTENKYKSSAGKAISEKEMLSIMEETSAKEQDLVILASGEGDDFIAALSILRNCLGERYDLIDQNMLGFAFVIDFPLLQWNKQEKRLDPTHHMFVLPKDSSLDMLEKNPKKVISTQFDAICNGYEICSGSRRIHTSDLQRKIMKMIGLSDKEIDEKFSHLLQAFDFGAPPHGGAAPGLDRLLMVLTNTKNIRDVIAFPKTQRGQDLMMHSPSIANENQLNELSLSINYEKMKEERKKYLIQKQENKL